MGKFNNVVSSNIHNKIINALFGSREAFNAVRGSGYFEELDIARIFAAKFIDESNVDVFCDMFLKNILIKDTEEYIDREYSFEGLLIPYAETDAEDLVDRENVEMRIRERQKKIFKKRSVEEHCYSAMYSCVKKYRNTVRNDIVNRQNLEEIQMMSEAIFREWKEAFINLNGPTEKVMEILKTLKCPGLRPKAWKAAK